MLHTRPRQNLNFITLEYVDISDLLSSVEVGDYGMIFFGLNLIYISHSAQ